MKKKYKEWVRVFSFSLLGMMLTGPLTAAINGRELTQILTENAISAPLAFISFFLFMVLLNLDALFGDE